MEVTAISNLLLDEHPLQVMPTLATLIGLNEAIILQQVHYWLKHKEKSGQDYIDGHYWVYNTYKQWQEQFPFWHLNTLQRAFTSLEKKGLLISANYNKAGFDKTKWYTIDYNAYESMVSTSHQNGMLVTPDCIDGTHQNGMTNTIDYTDTTAENIKSLNGTELKQFHTLSTTTPFNSSILEKQIIKSCHKQGITDCCDYITIIEYYYSMYMATFHKEHPRLSSTAMDSVIESIYSGSELVDNIDPDMYKALISQHFKTLYDNCDYNICHFMSEGIRNNRFYEACY